jgi:hypothetical protein
MVNSEDKIIVFEDKKIRRTWFDDDWWYVVEDIVYAITDSNDPKQYIQRLKLRDLGLLEGWVQIVHTLDIETSGGKQKMNCTNTKGAFRIIQSIPSKRAEPFKMWLAQLGQERIEEIENPELAQDRVKKYYEMKGYPNDWVDKRLRGIVIRQELTSEWKQRGIKEKKDFAILTNEIHNATFELSIDDYKKFKKLEFNSKVNLRDHMSDLELIFSMLGEKSTTEITKNKNSKGFENLKIDSIKGGSIAKNARLELEKETISDKNNF